MKLWTVEVGVLVVVVTVGVDGPEHGSDNARIAGRLKQFVSRTGGSFAGDDVIHRLAYDVGLRVLGKKTDSNFIRRHGWKELLRIATYVEAVQQ